MNNEENNALEELSNILKMLLKHLKMIITTIVITLAIFAFAVFFVVKPKYQSTSEIIVNQKLNKNNQYTELQQAQSVDLQLINTYKSILNSQLVSNAVEKDVGSKDYNQSQLSVGTDPTSQVINLNVTSHDAKNAALVANRTAKVFKQKITKIMNIDNVAIISKAQVNKNPVFPNKMLSLLAGVFVGLILGIFISLFIEFNAKTINDVDYISNELGLNNLGKINNIDIRKIKNSSKKHKRLEHVKK